jgi:GTPase Era involved in 16S rRNA processing
MNYNIPNITGKKEQIKEKLILFSDEFSSYLGGNRIDNLNYLIGKVEEDSVNFAVIGQFKRGKSTFINAIIGEDILPSAVLPLTSVLTAVKHNDSVNSKIYFFNGEVKEIKTDELIKYISEEHNPGNILDVKYAEVGYPNDILKRGITFIDTPGIGSVNKNNTLLTYEYIPKIDAAVFITSPDPALSEIEVEFFNEILKITDEIFVVLNKKDYLNDSQLKEVIEFTNKIISSRYPGYRFKIFPVSSRDALKLKINNEDYAESGIVDFENYLIEFYESKKQNILFGSVKRQFNNLLKGLEAEFELEKKSYSIPVEELREKNERLNGILDKILTDKKEIYDNIVKDLKNIYLKIQRIIVDGGEILSEKIKDEIKNYYNNNCNNKKQDFRKIIDIIYSESVIKGLDELRLSAEKNAAESARGLSEKYILEYNNTINLIYQAVSNLFEIRLDRIEQDYEFNFPEYFEYITYEFKLMLEIDITKFTGFFGRKFHNRIILKKYMKRIDTVLNYNLSYIYDSIAKRLDKYFRNLNIRLSDVTDETDLKIRAIIKKVSSLKNSQEKIYENNISDFNIKYNKLKEIRNSVMQL